MNAFLCVIICAKHTNSNKCKWNLLIDSADLLVAVRLEGAVKMILQRVRDKLRVYLEKEGVGI